MKEEDEIDKIRQFCLTVAEYTVCFIDAENVLNRSNTEAYETSEIPCGSMRPHHLSQQFRSWRCLKSTKSSATDENMDESLLVCRVPKVGSLSSHCAVSIG
jgi:hypothetical protein